MKKGRLILLSSLLVASSLFLAFGGKKKPSRPYLTVVGPLHMADGIGRQSVELIETLKGKVSIGFIPTNRPIYRDVPKEVRKIVRKANRNLGNVILFEGSVWMPHTFDYQLLEAPSRPDEIRIAYSMFESTEIPHEWTFILNRHFDAIAVPDPFLIEVYQNSGVTIPIFLLPLGRNLQPYLTYTKKRDEKKPFTFGNFCSCLDRKNHLTLIRAFAKAFGNNPNVRLILNMRTIYNPGLLESIREEIGKLRLKNISLTTLELSQNSQLDLMNELDCYVSLSKGEGFSILPREALSMGIPVIATDNTAQTTLCKSGFVRPVVSTGVEPAYFEPFQRSIGEQFTCSVDDVVKAMLEVYHNYPFYEEKALLGKRWASQYDFSALSPLYSSLICPEKIVLGESNSLGEGFLITNSPSLYEKYTLIKQGNSQ